MYYGPQLSCFRTRLNLVDNTPFYFTVKLFFKVSRKKISGDKWCLYFRQGWLHERHLNSINI